MSECASDVPRERIDKLSGGAIFGSAFRRRRACRGGERGGRHRHLQRPRRPGGAGAVADLGVDVPGEVSVVGFDDLSLDWFGLATLTTVSVARDALGRRAGEMLELLMADGHDTEPRYLPVELLVRDTSGPVRGRR
ncbi:substrate-binding domain-containing protein [Nonomuraea antimicrobica]|uniref:substrate-binding domain-containing protein n=1 Tax=Nonomuraea antimicrobica TaxID=561173 RepID=UPI003CD0571D